MAKAKLAHFVGLRGLCMIPIFLHHFWIDFYFGRPRPVNLANDWRTLWLMNGPFAVGIFFALSGRLLARSLYHKPDAESRARWLAQSMLRRPLRLLLPILILLYIFRLLAATPFLAATRQRFEHVVLPFGKVDAKDGDMHHYNRPDVSWLAPLRDMAALIRWKHPDYFILWTVPYQLWYSYAVFVLAAIAIQFKRTAPLLLALMVAVPTKMGMSTRIGFFPLGLLFCHLAETGAFETRRWWNSKVVTWALFGVAMIPYFGYLYPWEKNFISRPLERLFSGDEYLIRLFGVLPLFFWLELNPVAPKLLSHPALVWLGQVSFQFYLTGRFAAYAIGTWTLSFWFGDHDFSITPTKPSQGQYAFAVWVVAMPIAFGASLAIADVFTNWVDTPCARLTEGVIARLEKWEEGAKTPLLLWNTPSMASSNGGGSTWTSPTLSWPSHQHTHSSEENMVEVKAGDSRV